MSRSYCLNRTPSRLDSSTNIMTLFMSKDENGKQQLVPDIVEIVLKEKSQTPQYYDKSAELLTEEILLEIIQKISL